MKFSSQFDQHDTWCPISELENKQQSTTLCWNIFKPDLFTQIFTATSRYPKCVTREIKIHTHYNKDMLSVTDSCSGFWGKIKFWARWTVSYVQHHTSKFFLFSEKTDKHILTLAVLRENVPLSLAHQGNQWLGWVFSYLEKPHNLGFCIIWQFVVEDFILFFKWAVVNIVCMLRRGTVSTAI